MTVDIGYIQSKQSKIEIVDTLPKPEELPDGTIYGLHSCCLPSGKIIIPYSRLRVWNELRYTETGFTRSFLRTLSKRKIHKQEYVSYLLAKTPLYVRPAIIEDAVYIDLVSAYQSIYSRVGWDVFYNRGEYLGTGARIEYPFPNHWKVGRSYVVTGTRHVFMSNKVYGGKLICKQIKNPYSNPPMVAVVYDVLAMIARFAVSAFRAKYYNVDGGIFPRNVAPYYLEFIHSLGLDAKIKYEGRGVVYTSGSWRVGAHETLSLQKQGIKGIHGGEWLAMNEKQSDWLYKQFAKL